MHFNSHLISPHIQIYGLFSTLRRHCSQLFTLNNLILSLDKCFHCCIRERKEKNEKKHKQAAYSISLALCSVWTTNTLLVAVNHFGWSRSVLVWCVSLSSVFCQLSFVFGARFLLLRVCFYLVLLSLLMSDLWRCLSTLGLWQSYSSWLFFDCNHNEGFYCM